MRLTLPPVVIGETDGFTEENDLFGYSEFGERLANLVLRVDEPLVVALDGPWGSGKSTFARQWAGLLRNRGVPVIVFDAFANDHQEDAFIALAGEVAAIAQSEGEGPKSSLAAFVQNAKKVGHVLVPFAVKASIRAASLGILSAGDFEELGDGVKGLITGASGDIEALTEQLIEERLSRAQADRDALEAFRASLGKLAGALAEAAAAEHLAVSNQKAEDTVAGDGQDRDRNNSRPLVFIIDELDRCRPLFALNMLERVKHLFSVKGVSFVLVTHLPQLETVVQRAYGTNVDARTYLEKFFQLRVTLPERRVPHDGTRRRYVAHLWRSMELDAGDSYSVDYVQDGLVALSDAYNLSLRTIERVMAHVALVSGVVATKKLRLEELTVGLCVMRQIDRELYDKARSGLLQWQDAKDFLRLNLWQEHEQATQLYMQWWSYVTDDKLSEQEEWVVEISKSLRVHGFYRGDLAYRGDRAKILKKHAAVVDDLHLMGI